jgi:hypothetical protein
VTVTGTCNKKLNLFIAVACDLIYIVLRVKKLGCAYKNILLITTTLAGFDLTTHCSAGREMIPLGHANGEKRPIYTNSVYHVRVARQN